MGRRVENRTEGWGSTRLSPPKKELQWMGATLPLDQQIHSAFLTAKALNSGLNTVVGMRISQSSSLFMGNLAYTVLSYSSSS